MPGVPSPTGAALHWSENRDQQFKIESQSGEIRLNAKFDLYVYRDKLSAPAQKFLLVSLEGSVVKPTQGALAKDQDDIRGWFTEDVLVGIGFDDAAPGELVVSKDSPDTTSQAGSVSSSVSLNFSGGFFGDQPTANAGVAISNSFTASLADFSIVNRSTNDRVLHEVSLSMTREGHPYRAPKDLVDMSVGGQLTGALLLHPPDRAVSNLPLPSQAIFWAQQELNNDRSLRVTVTQRLRKVEKTFKFFTVEVKDWAMTETGNWTFKIPFSEVG
jgi:hypothetical protein